jgi:putative DNA primase/helicase
MSRLLGACGGAARNMGFIARNLIAWPESTIGKRPYREPPANMSASDQLNARLRELLDIKLSTEGPQMALVPPSLNLTWQAKEEWAAFFNETERELCRSGEFGDIADIGSKIAENAARMAGMFHVFEQGPGGEIGKQLMESAVTVVAWHLSEARRVICANRKPEEFADAELLLEWFLRQEDKVLSPREIQQLGPNSLRKDTKRRDRAVKILVDRHWLLEVGKPARLVLNHKARVTS